MSKSASFLGGLLAGVTGVGFYLYLTSQQKKREKERLINQLQKTKNSLDDKKELLKEINKELKDSRYLLGLVTEEKSNMEIHDKNFQLVVVIGLTGWGKSTLCNRLIGDKTPDGDSGGFKVGRGLDSETKDIIEERIIFNNKSYIIVDVPGFGDSNTGNDESSIDDTEDIFLCNKVIRYLKGNGGVNAFVLVVSLREERFSRELRILLRSYQSKFLTEKPESKILFWKHVIMVFTNSDIVDTNGAKNTKDIANQKRKIKEEFKLEFDLPYVIFGKDRFIDSKTQLIRLVPNNKYCTKEIRSLSDELASKINTLEEEQKQTKNDIKKLEKQTENIEIHLKYCS